MATRKTNINTWYDLAAVDLKDRSSSPFIDDTVEIDTTSKPKEIVKYDESTSTLTEVERLGNYQYYYPNVPSGYPSVRLELEELPTLQLPINWRSGINQKRYPITYLVTPTNRSIKPYYVVCIPTYEVKFTSDVIPNKFVTKLVKKNTDTELTPIPYEYALLDLRTRPNTLYINTTDVNERVYYFTVNNTMHEVETTNRYNSFGYSVPSDLFQIQGTNTVYLDAAKFKSPANGETLNTNILRKALYSYNIGSSCNDWYILTVDYYFLDDTLILDDPTQPKTEVYLGTYKCTFNPYVMDVILNYNEEVLEPETSYHGYGITYLPLYLNIQESLSGIYVATQTDNFRSTPQGTAGNSDLSGGMFVSHHEGFDKDEAVSGWTYTVPGNGGSSSALNFGQNWDFNDPDLTNYTYLYNSLPTITDRNYEVDINFRPNNAGFSLCYNGSQWCAGGIPRLSKALGTYTLFPSLKDKAVYTLNYDSYVENYSASFVLDHRDTAYRNIHLTDVNEIKTLPSQALYSIYFLVSNINFDYKFQTNLGNVNHYYNVWNDSELLIDFDKKITTSVTNEASYQVAPQFNVMCKIDELSYPGYSTSTGVYRANLDYKHNYLMLDINSEKYLNFNGDYDIKHFGTGTPFTSIYHSGFTYYSLPSGGQFNTVNLEAGIYYLNFNSAELNPSPVPLLYIDITQNGSTITHTLNGTCEYILVLTKDSSVTLRLYNFTNALLTSCGLYKVVKENGTPALQTNYDLALNHLSNGDLIDSNGVTINGNLIHINDIAYPLMAFTYSEVGKSCLNIPSYSHSGTNAFHGYQRLAPSNSSYRLITGNATETEINSPFGGKQTYTCRI